MPNSPGGMGVLLSPLPGNHRRNGCRLCATRSGTCESRTASRPEDARELCPQDFFPAGLARRPPESDRWWQSTLAALSYLYMGLFADLAPVLCTSLPRHCHQGQKVSGHVCNLSATAL